MRLDVIIPFKDAEIYLPNICADLENQTFRDFTVHFVSDHSVDGSLEYLSQKFSFEFKVHESAEVGPGAARNLGIISSSNEYILFIDADDRVSKNYLLRFYEKAVSTKADIIECMYQSIDTSGNIISGTNLESFISSNDRFMALVYGDVPRLSWGKAYKREMIESKKAFFPNDIHNGEDHIFLLEAYKDSPHIEIICEQLYSWVRYSHSLTNREPTRKTVEDFVKVGELKSDILGLVPWATDVDGDKLLKFSRRTFKEARMLISKIKSDSSESTALIELLRELIGKSDKLGLVCDTLKSDSTSYWQDVMTWQE
ncbi:glycosyltransferase family 2 protein [Pseudomonas citronellolis]|uniref:glycosyltransferase family 2 protein n=1 Tax=Pseudomonas citronellolis TaxID=53408 RepID=UPI0009EEF465|nr:glycosyltransferase family 2 protein [Pseudomonas citronellolis]